MSVKTTLVEDDTNSTYRPPTHGGGRILWYMTSQEWELFVEGFIEAETIERRIQEQDRESRPFKEWWSE